MKVVLQNITKTFPSREKNGEKDFTAVDSFSYEIPDGKLIGLLGPSGCGKSTLLNMICGLQAPTKGKIFFGDKDVTTLPAEKRGVGMVFQNYALYPHLTVEKNILFPLENLKGANKLAKDELKKRVSEAARLVQIEELMSRKPSQLSGGQQQRVAIARALVKMPNVLLLDEPLSNLDARLRIQTREEIKRIQSETKITTIFVTHDQDEALSISDYIVVMNAGKVQQIGKPQEVYDNPKNLFVAKFLGIPPINVFDGKIKNGKLFIGDDEIFTVSENDDKAADTEVFVAIRPEGFILKKNGRLKCSLKEIEIMGRDISIVSTNPNSHNSSVRAIIDAEHTPTSPIGTVSFDLKPNKVFVFDKKTTIRHYFDLT